MFLKINGMYHKQVIKKQVGMFKYLYFLYIQQADKDKRFIYKRQGCN